MFDFLHNWSFFNKSCRSIEIMKLVIKVSIKVVLMQKPPALSSPATHTYPAEELFFVLQLKQKGET